MDFILFGRFYDQDEDILDSNMGAGKKPIRQFVKTQQTKISTGHAGMYFTFLSLCGRFFYCS
jgi:hypothetical protein